MQLADHDTLSSVDHKGASTRHERQFAHVDTFFFGAGLVFQLKPNVEGRAISFPVALSFKIGQLGLADLVFDEIERDLFVIAGDGENLAEDGLQAILRPFGRGRVLLKELDVRLELDLDEVGRFDRLLDFSKVKSL